MTEVSLPALTGPVEVVGAGLIGTSIGLVCRRLGLDVVLRDTSEENVRTATGLGAGRAAGHADRPQLVVVAVPPAALAATVVDALRRTDAVVTDVGSVKAAPLEAVAATVRPAELRRYVGSHPMAGTRGAGRDQGRRQRPRPVAADPGRQRRGGARPARRGADRPRHPDGGGRLRIG